jgi:hypothetical protein
MGDDEGLLTEEAAALLPLSLPRVRQLRLAGSGPPHVEICRQTRYRQAVVQGWLAGEDQRSSAADKPLAALAQLSGRQFTGMRHWGSDGWDRAQLG